MSLPERFWAKVNKHGPVPPHEPKLGPCWVWTACKDRRGYGIFQMKTRHTVKAHRAALAEHLGRSLLADALHKCGNSSCVNPDHLYEGDDTDNVRDRDLHGTSAKRERNGNAKLKLAAVEEIRVLLAKGLSYSKIADQFGVGTSQVCRIANGEHWA